MGYRCGRCLLVNLELEPRLRLTVMILNYSQLLGPLEDTGMVIASEIRSLELRV
jgi:hypothetical protein